MGRAELVCPRCHQVNVRYDGIVGAIVRPRGSSTCCQLCQADLVTGDRDWFDAFVGAFMFAAVYLIHAMVGLMAIGVPVVILLYLRWPTVVEDHAIVRIVPLLLGTGLGALLAERSRRQRTLLGRATMSG